MTEASARLLHQLTHEQQWECLQGEVLVWLIGDGVIDDDERTLLSAACELYLGHGRSYGRQIQEEEWRAMVRHAAGVSSQHERYDRLRTSLSRRLSEAGHDQLSSGSRQQLVAWATSRHSPPPQRELLYSARPPYRPMSDPYTSMFQRGIPIRPQRNFAAISIADSFEAWSRRLGYQPPAGRHIEAPPPVAPIYRDVSPLNCLAPRDAATVPAHPSPAELGPPAPEIPEPETVSVDVEALKQRLREQLEGDPHLSVLQTVARDPAGFFRTHAAFAQDQASRVWFVNPEAVPSEVWFAGDVHGDLLAFEAVCNVFEQMSAPGARLVFLGDLVDRGFDDRAVVLALWAKMLAAPGRFSWVVGNHDTGITYDAERERFTASVSPAEFPDWLNEHLDDPSVVALGRSFVEMAAVAPCALFLPGLLAAHGGFPHTDRWASLQTREDLSNETNLSDFVWNRLTPQRTRIPNRTGRSSSFGAEDFHGFRAVMREALGWEVEAMVRGHDHVHETQARWDRPTEVRRANFEGRVLTVNTLSHNQPGEINPYTPANPRHPTLARWRVGTLPTPIVAELTEELVVEYAKPCPKCVRPRAAGDCACAT